MSRSWKWKVLRDFNMLCLELICLKYLWILKMMKKSNIFAMLIFTSTYNKCVWFNVALYGLICFAFIERLYVDWFDWPYYALKIYARSLLKEFFSCFASLFWALSQTLAMRRASFSLIVAELNLFKYIKFIN